jgi:retron-type reverse transcriptase
MITEEKLNFAVRQQIITYEEKDLINEYSERLNKNNMPVIFNLRHVRKIFDIKKKDQDRFFGNQRFSNYHKFEIHKKNGGIRTIEAPNDDLKAIQTWIKEKILDNINVSEHAKGFKKNTNIVDNAKLHVEKELVINLDLKDFFPSITYAQIYRIFCYFGYNNQVSHLLTKLCTNNENVLPQGSPASPSISNIVSLKLDKRLSKLADTYKATYSRYADDVSFSGSKYIKNILSIAYKIINDEKFEINEQKVRLQYCFMKQEVTGLIVNKKVTISNHIVKELDNAIYYCQKYGVVSHMKRIGCDKSFYKEHLYGLAYFVKMVDIEKGVNFLKQLSEVVWDY